MIFARQKKADAKFLVGMLLVIASIILLLYLITNIFSQNDEQAEFLCWLFNAARYGMKVSSQGDSIIDGSLVCKTIDKKDPLPSKKYAAIPGGKTGGAKREVGDMMASCWHMWLEGSRTNMFDTSTVSASNKCFVCYTFSLDSGISLSQGDIITALLEPKDAIDSSDRCRGEGGGYCRSGCATGEKRSGSCRNRAKPDCCISSNRKNICLDKGGKCGFASGYRAFPDWSCSSGTCYVKQENFISYLDYLQGKTAEGQTGKGYLVFQNGLSSLEPANSYSITLVSPGTSPSW